MSPDSILKPMCIPAPNSLRPASSLGSQAFRKMTGAKDDGHLASAAQGGPVEVEQEVCGILSDFYAPGGAEIVRFPTARSETHDWYAQLACSLRVPRRVTQGDCLLCTYLHFLEGRRDAIGLRLGGLRVSTGGGLIDETIHTHELAIDCKVLLIGGSCKDGLHTRLAHPEQQLLELWKRLPSETYSHDERSPYGTPLEAFLVVHDQL